GVERARRQHRRRAIVEPRLAARGEHPDARFLQVGEVVGVVDVVERIQDAPARRDREAEQRLSRVVGHAADFLLDFGLSAAGSTLARKRPVCDPGLAATSSGVPVAMTCPPRWPPSGPRSTTQSAVLITSRLCSITTMVLP